MADFKHKDGLTERIHWLIRLRWLAVIGVVATVLFVERIVGLNLPVFPPYSIAVLLGTYNLVFFIWMNTPAPPSSIIANTQISLDLLSLTALLHFSGGVENPFIFYFIFHMIIASILLSRRASFLQATLAILLFVAMAASEYLGILPHYHLEGFIPVALYNNLVYVFGVFFVFTSTLYIAVYMATSISAQLREREKSLKEANLLLEAKDRIKSEYVLRVSHDIKEHLSTIESCIQPVTNGMMGELNPKQKDLLQRADERTNRLLFFVRALLEITRLKLSKKIEMENFSLRKTIEHAATFIDSTAKNKNIGVSFNIDPAVDMVNGAQIYIEETIANLLANSVKYTPRGGKIGISVKDKGSSILLEISDTGIGIPKDGLPKVFDEFYRARNAKEVERSGTGLGLAIAKQVVQMHGGRIWVESEENKGSTFSIILPKWLKG